MRKSILILSEPYGGGHTSVAKAIAASLDEWDVSVMELGPYLQPWITKGIAKGYLQTVRKAPWVWNKIYSSSLTGSHAIPFLYSKLFFSKLSTLLLQQRPEFIIATHPFPATAIASLRNRGIHIPLVGVPTDFHIHPSWYLGNWDVLCIPYHDSFNTYRHCRSYTIPTGIPVRPEYKKKLPKQRSLQALQLDPLHPVILWMGGKDGLHKKMEWISNIPSQPKIQWIFVTGHNTALFQYLQQRIGALDHVKVLPFINNIAELMDASDLLITKAGGVTCSEAIHKELPIILGPCLPGQEEENEAFLLRNGLAFFSDEYNLWNTIQFLLNQTNLTKQIRKNMQKYKQSIQPDSLKTMLNFLVSKGGVIHEN